MNRVAKQKGFTIIELLLAMAFISVLLLAIALTILQIATTYNRGMIMKETNQASRAISDELGRAISSTSSFAGQLGGGQYVTSATGGRLCLGSYSYIWNYGKALYEENNDVTTYSDSETPIRFIKVPDNSRDYCSGLPAHQDIASAGAVELLAAGDHALVVHQLSIIAPSTTAIDSGTNQRLITLVFSIGTNEIEALDETQTACKPPSIAGSDLTYCSVQTFSIVLRAGNGVN